MCGIVGYIGQQKAAPILIEGLQKLEYRGYDSAGLAFVCDKKIEVVKEKGKLKELIPKVNGQIVESFIGIGHTRWATHGPPSRINAHPHIDCRGNIVLVHNGIIENFNQLKEDLKSKGHRFASETDTEVLAHLIEDHYQDDLVNAVKDGLTRVEGSYAIAVMVSDKPDLLVAARKDSPLIIGIGQGENFIASDIPAVINHTREVLILDNNEIAEVTKDKIKIYNQDLELIDREVFEVKWDAESAEKGGYEDFMLKEIHEQPVAVQDTLRGRIADSRIFLEEMILSDEEIKDLNKVFIIACGTSYHAGLTAKIALERWARLPVEIDISSEFRYRKPIINDKTLVVAISQSGETADTLAGIKSAKNNKSKIIAITNVVGSTITREADGIIYTHAGPEIGVAATKTLTSQMTALLLLSLYLAQARNSINKEEIENIINEIRKIPNKLDDILKNKDSIKENAKKYYDKENFLFLGRSSGYPVALEGALKLKEISYIHAEAYPAGEMKHGPIALLDENVPVVVIATKGQVHEKVISNTQEVRARNAPVIAVANPGDGQIEKLAETLFIIPETLEELSPVIAVVPLQLMAYYIAKLRGCNVDQPRNLAKSVTVE